MNQSDDSHPILPEGNTPWLNAEDKARILRFVCFTIPFGGFLAILRLLWLTLLHGRQIPESETHRAMIRMAITFGFWGVLYHLTREFFGWWQ